MPKPNRAYAEVDSPSPVAERYLVEWYWRVFAFAAQWMILAGFLSLQPLFDAKDEEFRVSRTVLTALSIAFLVAGFIISLLVFFVCKSWKTRLSIVCLPGLSSCSLGLFALLYPLAVSSRFSAGGPAGFAGVFVGTLSTLAYGGLTILAHYKCRNPTSPRQLQVPLQHLFRTTEYAQRSPLTTHYESGEAPVHIIPAPPLSPEEEETRMQMSRLLHEDTLGRRRASRASDPSTYHIEWPHGNTGSISRTPTMPAAPRLRSPTSQEYLDMPAHVRDYYFDDEGPRGRTGSASTTSAVRTAYNSSPEVVSAAPSSATGTGMGVGLQPGAHFAAGNGYTVSPLGTPRQRSDSRENRRREIEEGR